MDDVLKRAQLLREIGLRYDVRDGERCAGWLDEAVRRLKASKKRITKAAIFRLIDVFDAEWTMQTELGYAASLGW